MSYFMPSGPKKEIDLYKLLPDNVTMGTEQFYKEKFGDKFPDETYQYLEVKTRKEYNNHDVSRLIEQININKKDYEIQLFHEFKEREEEIDEVDLNEIISNSNYFFVAK